MLTDGGRPEQDAGYGRPQLQVYVTAGCLGCVRAGELVAFLRRARPGADVQTIDLDRSPEARPAGLVGTPTYRLRGRLRWLGNPAEDELLAAWDDAAGRDRATGRRGPEGGESS